MSNKQNEIFLLAYSFFLFLLSLLKVFLDQMTITKLNLNGMQPVHFCKYSVNFVLILPTHLQFPQPGFSVHLILEPPHPLRLDRHTGIASLSPAFTVGEKVKMFPLAMSLPHRKSPGNRDFHLNQLQFPCSTSNLYLWMLEKYHVCEVILRHHVNILLLIIFHLRV